jgi:hypothetical protein
MGSVASAPHSAGWLKDRSFDLSFTVGIPLLAAVAAILGGIEPGLFVIIVVADLWLLGYHHVVSTFTKLAGTREDRHRNRWLIWLLPAILVITFGAGALDGLVAVVTLYFFWQWFHYVRQSWGIGQRYRFRGGGIAWESPRLAEVTMWAVPVWGVLYRCHQNPDTFLDLPLWLPPVPALVVDAVGLVALGLVIWWCLGRVRAWRRGELAVGHTLYVLSHFAIFAVAYRAIPDISLGWLLVNVWHNAQYIAFVWLHNRQRFARGVTSDARALSWLSQAGAGRAFTYYLACTAVSTAMYMAATGVHRVIVQSVTLSSISFLLLFSMGLNFHHYVVDSLIWKRRREPTASAGSGPVPAGAA